MQTMYEHSNLLVTKANTRSSMSPSNHSQRGHETYTHLVFSNREWKKDSDVQYTYANKQVFLFWSIVYILNS